MSRKPPKTVLWLLSLAIVCAGCYPTRPIYLRETGDMSYYLDQATAVEYPDVQVNSLDEVTSARTPITVIDPDFDQFYDLTLEQSITIAIKNTKVIRGYGTPTLQGSRVAPGIDNLTNGVTAAATLYNVSVRETEPGFLGTPGQISPPASITTNTGLDANIGPEAALADFDAQFTTSMFWTRSDEPRNTVAPFDQLAFRQDQVQLQSEIAKKSAVGTQFFARSVNIYTANNIPLASDPINPGFQILPSWWRSALEFEVRQPLLRGRGAFVQRMPIIISRIGVDQEIANLEAQLHNLVTNVEIRYWDLQAAYRNLDAAKKGRDAALETQRIIHDQFRIGGQDITIQSLAQANEQYYFFVEQVTTAFNDLLAAESALRFLLGLAHTDGLVIRPIDEPTAAPVEFEWCESLDEALTYRPELRLERWEIKKRELALAYAKNGLLPELNVSAQYRWLGLGDHLISYDDPAPDFPAAGSGAINDMFGGNFQEVQFSGEFRMPVGYRRELANVRNAQVKLARELARLEDMELNVSSELAEAYRALAANLVLMQLAFNRWAETKKEIDHFKRVEDAGLITLDVALDAQRRHFQAELSFYTALAEYNKVIALLHRRKGTILAYNGVGFAEGMWPGKAYHDAEERARKRSASTPVNYGWTRPGVISQGPVWPSLNSDCAPGALPYQGYFEDYQDPTIDHPYYRSYPEGEQSPEPIDIRPRPDALPIPDGRTTLRIHDAPVTQQQATFVVGNSQGPSGVDAWNSAADRVLQTAMPALAPDQSVRSPVSENTRVLGNGTSQSIRTGGESINHVDWEKFGLTRPDLREGVVNASIRPDSPKK